jgi:hypothetical protein
MHPEAAAAVRGLVLLQTTLIVFLVASLIGGAAQSWLRGQALEGHYGVTGMSVYFMGFRVMLFVTSVAQLVAFGTLAKGPRAAGVAVPARVALVMEGLALLIGLLNTAAFYVLIRFWTWQEIAQVTLYAGYLDMLMSFIGAYFTVEVLVRLRRYASADQTAGSDSGRGWQAAILIVLVLRMVAGYGSDLITTLVFGQKSAGAWAAFAVRAPFTLVYYGLLLWYVQSTLAVVRTLRDARGLGLAVAGTGSESGDAARRNMIFGVMWMLGGAAVSVLTYQSAHQLGGRYVVAYGAIIAGFAQFIRGLTQLLNPPRPSA